jgi:formate dehydrogenase maturation protein FdhE
MLLNYDEEREKDYVAGEGTICPICGSENVRQDGRIEVEDGIGTCYCSCDDCGGNWTEVWHLVGITAIYTKPEDESGLGIKT